jgi:hypothetical protein
MGQVWVHFVVRHDVAIRSILAVPYALTVSSKVVR